MLGHVSFRLCVYVCESRRPQEAAAQAALFERQEIKRRHAEGLERQEHLTAATTIQQWWRFSDAFRKWGRVIYAQGTFADSSVVYLLDDSVDTLSYTDRVKLCIKESVLHFQEEQQ